MSMAHDVFRYSLRRFIGTAGEYRVHERWATIPNAITVAGIIGVVFYTWLFLTNSIVWAIPLVHIGVLLSDMLDGIAADALDQHSRAGKFLEPLRDRMHAAALFGNLILAAPESGVVAALVIAVAAETWIGFLAFRGFVHNVHAVGKIRATVYGICGLAALVQLYWVKSWFVPLSAFAITMAAASLGTAICYSAKRP